MFFCNAFVFLVTQFPTHVITTLRTPRISLSYTLLVSYIILKPSSRPLALALSVRCMYSCTVCPRKHAKLPTTRPKRVVQGTCLIARTIAQEDARARGGGGGHVRGEGGAPHSQGEGDPARGRTRMTFDIRQRIVPTCPCAQSDNTLPSPPNASCRRAHHPHTHTPVRHAQPYRALPPMAHTRARSLDHHPGCM